LLSDPDFIPKDQLSPADRTTEQDKYFIYMNCMASRLDIDNGVIKLVSIEKRSMMV